MKKSTAGFLFLGSLVMAGCGGSSSPSAPSAPAQPIVRNIDGSVDAFGSNYHAATLNVGGSVSVALNWGTSVDLDLYVTSTNCDALYPRAQCPVLAQSNGFNKPETVALSLNAGQYRVWVDNMSLVSGTAYTLTVTAPPGNATAAVAGGTDGKEAK